VSAGTDLSGANLSSADLSGAKLLLTLYSRRTIFPDNFDPKDHKEPELLLNEE